MGFFYSSIYPVDAGRSQGDIRQAKRAEFIGSGEEQRQRPPQGGCWYNEFSDNGNKIEAECPAAAGAAVAVGAEDPGGAGNFAMS